MDAGAYAILAAVLAVCAVQLWAVIDAGRRGGAVWGVVVWFTFPFGLIAWLAYGRRRTAATSD